MMGFMDLSVWHIVYEMDFQLVRYSGGKGGGSKGEKAYMIILYLPVDVYGT